jgi:polysaccharide biosynthesis PFTS motif protein
VSYAKYPLRDLLYSSQIPFKSRLAALLSHLMLAPRVLLDTVRAPVATIAAPDCAYAALTKHLDRCGLIENIVITNSLYMSQPLWMCALPDRRFRAHMVWYSQNTVPVVYATDNERSNIPNYRHMRLDEHWVWTEQYAKQLRDLGSDATLHTVGPILWYLPEAGSHKGTVPTVVVFDVSPVTEGFARQIGLVKNYYAASITDFKSAPSTNSITMK